MSESREDLVQRFAQFSGLAEEELLALLREPAAVAAAATPASEPERPAEASTGPSPAAVTVKSPGKVK